MQNFAPLPISAFKFLNVDYFAIPSSSVDLKHISCMIY